MGSECTCRTDRQSRVVILMSAYNGENYISEQIDSILGQTYPYITLLVRDDGSSDGTVPILESYEAKGQLKLLRGENVGFVNSFFMLMQASDEADYYAWCDQDDIWVPDKIRRAVDKLEEDRASHQEAGEDIPVLYFSGYDYYDEKMTYQRSGLSYQRGPSFANSLMDCITLGFNSVFNHAARMRMERNLPEQCCGHDWWTYMVCAAFGRVIYDRKFSAVKYRRLEQSVSPGGKNFIALQLWRFKKFFVNDYFAKIRAQLCEFARLYLPEMEGKDEKLLRMFADDSYSFRRAVRKTFYPVWFRQGILEELMVRVLFLTGKL